MQDRKKDFFAGIIDFNPKRMTNEEAERRGIPQELQAYLADQRQYPCNIAKHFKDNVTFFSPEQPWFFREVMSDPERMKRLQDSETLILSGSGLSAYKYQENDPTINDKDREYLAASEHLVQNMLAQGKWILGICFGGQIAIHAVGGKIGRLPNNQSGNAVTEAGWLEHTLTEAGKNDEVFGGLPETFSAPHLHNDFVAELPKIGTQIQTEFGVITVVRTEILAIRKGYLDKDGVKASDREYIHASLVEFDRARLYQIQPHPEMAQSLTKANFLARQNSWIGSNEEMGNQYYEECLRVPENADMSVAQVVTRFTEEARKHLETKYALNFAHSVVAQNFDQYLLT